MTNGSIGHFDEDGNQTTEFLQVYSEEEVQNNKINKTNAQAVFKPKFIPYYPEIAREYQLTNTEALIYGFIEFFKASNKNRFYFSNEQIAEVVGCSADTASRSIGNLEKKGLIDTSKKIKAGGGTIRFVNRVFDESESAKPTSQNRQNLQALYINNNKINKNILSKDNIVKTNFFVTSLVSKFTETKGHQPIDTDHRRQAYSLSQTMRKTLKDLGFEDSQEKFESLVKVYFEWLTNLDYFENIKRMKNVREHWYQYREIFTKTIVKERGKS